jgi:N-acetylglutamate synthase-like GNAT family acetyltransferase
VVAYRQARLDDAADIHALLLRLAPEIPILVETLEREEALYTLTRNCVRSGESWVAVDEESGLIVGFVLVEPAQQGRHYAEEEVLELHHAGVVMEHRGGGIFHKLIAKILARMVPLTAIVPAQNRSDIAARLERLGFRRSGSTLRWDPGSG